MVQLRSRFIAGNALEIRWVLVANNGEWEEVNAHVGNESQIELELSNALSVYAVLANETCDVPVLPSFCHFNRSQVGGFSLVFLLKIGSLHETPNMSLHEGRSQVAHV